jgi:hypothetical protein
MAAVMAVAVFLRGAAAGAPPEPLREARAGVEIDWQEGTLRAQGGAAADLRMPSADLARPGAVRRARAVAVAKLKTALAELPLGGDRTLPAAAVERAIARARTAAIEYQSNGGALVSVALRFADWIDAPLPAAGGDAGAPPDAGTPSPSPPPLATLVVSGMRLAAAPLVRVGSREVSLGAAQYRLGLPPAAANALPARVDGSGRVIVEGTEDLAPKLARGVVLIYVQKVLR